jgi:hypothetical protein
VTAGRRDSYGLAGRPYTPPTMHDLDRREALVSLTGAILLVAVIVVDASLRGALGASRNDDWAYIRTAFQFEQTHRFTLNGWVTPTLLGQVVLASPVVAVVGRSIIALQVFTATLGALALWAWYLVLRRMLPRLEAVVAIAALGLGPVFGALTVSFMNDIPSLLAEAVVLLLGLRALRDTTRSTWWLVGSAMAGLFAFAIRDFAIVAFLGVLAVVLAHRIVAQKRVAATVAIGWGYAALAVAFWWWRRHLPHDLPLVVGFQSPVNIVVGGAQILLTTALFLAPIVALLSARRVVRSAIRASKLLSIGATLLVLFCLLAAHKTTFAGNYFERNGSYQADVVHGGPALVVGTGPWLVVRLIAAVSLLVLLLIGVGSLCDAAKSLRRGTQNTVRRIAEHPTPQLVVGVLTAGIVGVLALQDLLIGSVFDRYLLVLVPCLGGLVLAEARRRSLLLSVPSSRVTAALAGVVLFGFVGFAWVDTSAAFDGARWRLAQQAVSGVVPPASVNGGIEWYGFHQSTVIGAKHVSALGRDWWVAAFDGHPCLTVATQPDHAQTIKHVSDRTLLGTMHFYLTRDPSGGC